MRKNLSTRLFWVAVAFLIALPFVGRDEIKNTFLHATKDITDVYEMYASDFKKDQLVKADFYFCYDCIAEEYTTKNGVRTSTDSQYYLVPVGTEEYMIVNVPPKMFNKFDTLIDESYEYYFDETAPEPQTVYAEGRMEKLDKEIKGYLYEWFIDTDFFGTSDTSEMDMYILPYMMTYADWEGSARVTTFTLVTCSILLIIIVLAIIFTIKKAKTAKAMSDDYSDFPNYQNGNQQFGNQPFENNQFGNQPYQPTGNQNPYSYQPVDDPNRYSNRTTDKVPDLTAPYVPQDNSYAGMDSISTTTYDENQKPPCEL